MAPAMTWWQVIVLSVVQGLTEFLPVSSSGHLAITSRILFSLPDAFNPAGQGIAASGPQLLVATIIAFVVGFAAVAWFLRFLVRHSMYWFVGYRVLLGTVVLALLEVSTT